MSDERILIEVLDRLVVAHAITQEMLGGYTWLRFAQALRAVKERNPEPEAGYYDVPYPLDCQPMRQEVVDWVNDMRAGKIAIEQHL